MSLVLIFPTPATIAFGGVPTGIWKAILQDKAAGYIKNSGCISTAIAFINIPKKKRKEKQQIIIE